MSPPIKPMLFYAGTSLPADENSWAFEVKFDGYRAILYCDSNGVSIQSRQMKSMTLFYPELQALAAATRGGRLVLDGEIVAYDETGRQCFEKMQERAGRTGRPGKRMSRVPIAYQIFDVLELEGQDLCGRPYRERRQVLESLDLHGRHWSTPANHVGGGATALLEASLGAGLEGLVAKRLDSTYQPGERTRDWLKFKNWQSFQMLVGGWRPDPTGFGGWLGSLRLGYRDERGDLRYAGGCELGFKPEHVQALKELLPALESGENPFAETLPRSQVRFLEPRLMVEVQTLGWTSSGRLRQPIFRCFVVGPEARASELPMSVPPAARPDSRESP